MRLTFVLLGLLLVASATLGRPPPGADPSGATAQWYKSLTQNSGASCCSNADCRPVEAYTVKGHWIARVDTGTFGEGAPNNWVEIPDTAILHDRVSIEDKPVLCWHRTFLSGEQANPSAGVMCFIRSEQI